MYLIFDSIECLSKTYVITGQIDEVVTNVKRLKQTLDSIKNGDEIEIGERDRCELAEIGDQTVLPECFMVRNPAFDVTPSRFVRGFITEEGIKQKLP